MDVKHEKMMHLMTRKVLRGFSALLSVYGIPDDAVQERAWAKLGGMGGKAANKMDGVGGKAAIHKRAEGGRGWSWWG